MMDASGSSGHDGGAVEWPKKLCNGSEHVRERLEQRNGERPPGRAQDEPAKQGGESTVPGDVHSTREGPRSDTSDAGGSTDASSRDTGPGGRRGDEELSRGIEADSDRQMAVYPAGYDWRYPRGVGNECADEMDAPGRDRGPGGHIDKSGESRGVEGDLKRRRDGHGAGCAGNGCRVGGAMRGARRESK